jgi:hypothetical protein
MEKKIELEKNWVNVNYGMKAIEIKESFAKKAGIVGSEEYKALKELQSEHPTYEIIVIKRAKNTNKKTPSLKGIDCEFLYNYAKSHEKNDSARTFAVLKNDKAPFFKVMKTFLEYYPEFKGLKTKGEWLYLVEMAA